MKKSKKNYAVIVLIVLLLAIAIGYAAFSQTLIITGTATGTATWDVHFKSATLKDSSGATDTEHGTVSFDATTVTANITLKYPGDGVVLDAVIENSGTVPAKLTNVIIDGEAVNDDNIDIETAEPVIGETLAANGGTCTSQYVIKWASTSEITDLGSKQFTVTSVYDQVTGDEFTPSHSDTPTT